MSKKNIKMRTAKKNELVCCDFCNRYFEYKDIFEIPKKAGIIMGLLDMEGGYQHMCKECKEAQ